MFYVHSHAIIPCIKRYKLLKYLFPVVVLLEFALYFLLFVLISLFFGDLHFTWKSTGAFFNVKNTAPFVQPFLGYLIVASLLYLLEAALRENILWKGKSERRRIGNHFLVNYLFNVYGLLKKGMKGAVASIIWLQQYASFLMADEDEVPRPITQELQALRDLSAMEELRNPSRYSFYLIVGDGVSSLKVIPMVLLSLFENIRQHGLYLDPNYPARMELSAANDCLTIYTWNKLCRKDRKGGHGMALENLRARLEMHHAGKYCLRYGEKEGFFELQLEVSTK
ncbi:hypothetical protein H8S90_13890 [Olivibacter sp. SDN3]|uniref:hypothetical protein n=1 Tax=Olivibacter sp. SDN3 TaxID=2764720 RepID=UPI00165107F8|nr:hypothetical protein [Olivibacter sp. SDN3]QNL47910.1 hypothetical protein H8S90_13890 [Olivibacter sp. SDN3]